VSDRKTTEFAIQDEATGEWYCSDHKWRFGAIRVGPESIVTGSYCGVASTGRFAFDTLAERTFRDGARIVPAPPREMTDAECVEWWGRQDRLGITPAAITPGGESYEWRVGQPAGEGRTGCFFQLTGTLFDAIRAARKKLEGGR